jgi:hypothetical protein
MYPNLIIAGPTKTGTTSVFDWLSAHPDACPSNVKETDYFFDLVLRSNRTANFIEHGLSRYEGLFSSYRGQTVVFEASPSYLTANIALAELPKLIPQPKIVFIFRDPAERLYSEYKFSRYTTGTFEGSFEDYCNGELVPGRGSQVAKGKIISRMNRWVDSFGEDQIFVYHFDDLTANPREFMKLLCDDLGIDPEFYSNYAFGVANPSVVRRSQDIYKVASSVSRLLPDRLIKVFRPLYHRLNESPVPKPSDSDAEILEGLRKTYENETAEELKTKMRRTCG